MERRQRTGRIISVPWTDSKRRKVSTPVAAAVVTPEKIRLHPSHPDTNFSPRKVKQEKEVIEVADDDEPSSSQCSQWSKLCVPLSHSTNKYLTICQKNLLAARQQEKNMTAALSFLQVLSTLDDDDDVDAAWLSKQELMQQAEPLFGRKFETDPHLLHSKGYGAWSGIETLIKHEIVIRRKKGSRGDYFQLSPQGWTFCNALWPAATNVAVASAASRTAADSWTAEPTRKEPRKKEHKIFSPPKGGPGKMQGAQPSILSFFAPKKKAKR